MARKFFIGHWRMVASKQASKKPNSPQAGRRLPPFIGPWHTNKQSTHNMKQEQTTQHQRPLTDDTGQQGKNKQGRNTKHKTNSAGEDSGKNKAGTTCKAKKATSQKLAAQARCRNNSKIETPGKDKNRKIYSREQGSQKSIKQPTSRQKQPHRTNSLLATSLGSKRAGPPNEAMRLPTPLRSSSWSPRSSRILASRSQVICHLVEESSLFSPAR